MLKTNSRTIKKHFFQFGSNISKRGATYHQFFLTILKELDRNQKTKFS